MTGARMEFTLKDKKLSKRLKRLANVEDELAPFLKSIGEEFAGAGGVINTRFKTETGPDGEKWAPLADATITRRLKKYGNAPLTILRMRGILAGSINYQVSGSRLEVGTGGEAEDYAAIHQHGGKAGRNRKVKIPARPYLGFSDDDMDMIEEEAWSVFGWDD